MSVCVSVVIPVYNTEKYLDICMESVVNQTYKNLQIILVDDGATDHSPQMCDAWAARDSRIRLIHKQNEGLGLTRNAGLDMAEGKYVCFLDSDDTIELNTIETCVFALENNKAQACFYPRKTFKEDGSYTVCKNIPDKLAFEGQEVMNEFSTVYWGIHPQDDADPFIHSSVCRGMFLRSVLEEHSLRFMSERICLSEDVVFGLEFCKHVNKVIIIPEYFYNYTYNGTSLTKSYRPQRMQQAEELYRIMEKQLPAYAGCEDALLRCQHRYISMIQQCVEMEISTRSFRGLHATVNNVKNICNNEFVRKVFSEFPSEYAKNNRKLFIKMVLRKQGFLLVLLYYIKEKRK